MPHALKEDRNRYHNEYAKAHRAQRKETVRRYKVKTNRMAFKRSDAKRRYGLTYETYLEMKKRPCDICGKNAKKMCLDHAGPAAKFNGTHRGVLCQQCNTRLGWLERHKAIILAYLERPDASEI